MKIVVQPIKKTNIGNEIFEQLKEKLLHGEIKPGEKFPSENELADAFGVSRMTVRQAIQKLAVLGLLETKLGEGSYVREFSPGICMNQIIPVIFLGANSILEVLEFRTVVEGKTAELAALKATDSDISDLEESLNQMKQYKHDVKRFSEADLDFHYKLATITRNSILTKTYHIINDAMRMAMEQIVSVCGFSDGLHYHKLILDAIRDHDGATAKSIMTEHVEGTYQGMFGHISSNSNE